MGNFTTRDKLLAVLGLILVSGFLGVNLASFRVSSDSVRETLVQNELPLTSNNIYSEIQAGLLRPIYISSLMANDTFLKDWMLAGEEDVEKVTKYLREIRNRYDVFSTFVVSDITGSYYHFEGVLKKVSPHVQKDRWFFTMEDHDGDYRVDIDTNEAADSKLTVFVNHKIYDYDGQFIGVTGLGLDALEVSSLIQHYKQRYERDIYFVGGDGMIKSHENNSLIDKMDIRKQPGISSVADQLLAGDRGSLTYKRNGSRIFLRYRYIPELRWYLVVEQPEAEELAPLRRALYANLGISLLITLLVLVISGYTVQHFQHRLEKMARTDKPTDLFNRQYFETLYEHAIGIARRSDRPVSVLLFDIDRFKPINDSHGHLAGDRILRQVADVTRSILRCTDVVGRWGGDEMVVLLPDCDAGNAARLAGTLREAVSEQVREPANGPQVTISVGVATFDGEESRDSLLERADANLYRAKRAGRNRVQGDGAPSAAGPRRHAEGASGP